MRLRNKVLAILALVAALYIALDAGGQRYFIRPSFLALEQESTTRNMQRWLDALNREIHHLDTQCFDWSAWDDTYQFALDRNEDFIHTNLVLSAFTENQICLIYLFDTGGKVVWGKIYDASHEQFVSLPDFSVDQWPVTHPLLVRGGRSDAVTGVLMTALGPMLVAARSIFPSEGEAPPHGTFLMGRLLSEDLLGVLREQTHLDMQVWRVDQDTLPPEAAPMAARRPMQTVYLDEQNAQVLQAYATLPDIYGNPVLSFQLDAPRDILERGLTAMRLDVLTMVGATALVLALLLFLLQRHIIRPLTGLTRHAASMSESAEFMPYEGPVGRDEIGTLSREFNRMVDRVREEMSLHAQMEAALRDSEARIRTILETAPDGIITANEQGVIESLNRVAADLFGYDPAALIGQPVDRLLEASERHQVSETLSKLSEASARTQVLDQEVSGLHRSGRRIPLHIRVSPVPVGGARLYTAVLRDMTEIKQMQERVSRSRHLAAIGEMGAAVAHEIRNPLAGISGAVQIILNDLGPGYKHWGVLEEVQTSISRVENTVRRLLDYARSWHPEPVLCRILELVEEVSREAASDARFRQVKIHLEGDRHLELRIDPVLIRQVFSNLLTNAADAMPQGGTATWTVRDAGDSVEVTLRDTGCGIGVEAQERMTEPFFTTKAQGTGLGLAICQRIMEAHGAFLGVSSQPGAGTVVRLVFPKGE
jgi:PAS domain S-box-containing protein